jgi:antitoxin ParD1/3/4
MSKVEKISIALTDEMLASVKDAVASGDYASSSEVIRHALRDWKRQRQQDSIADIRQLIAQADMGGYAEFAGVEGVKARGRARLAEIKRAG